MAANPLGDSVTAVQRKQKAHANLQSEVATRQKAVTAAFETARVRTHLSPFSSAIPFVLCHCY